MQEQAAGGNRAFWASILLPLALAGAGLYASRAAIVTLGATMAQPQLLWAIGLTLGLGLVLALIAAGKVSRELHWSHAWEAGDERVHKALYPTLDRKSAVAGVYNLLNRSRNRVSDNFKLVLGIEFDVGRKRLYALLSLATFANGVLLALSLLGVLLNVLGATLFGLIGALFLSYLGLITKRAAQRVIVNLRAMVRRADAFLQLAESRTYQDHLDIAVRETTQWRTLFQELQANYQGILHESALTLSSIRELVQSNRQLADDLRKRDEAAEWQLLYEELRSNNREVLQATARTQNEIRNLLDSNRQLADGLRAMAQGIRMLESDASSIQLSVAE